MRNDSRATLTSVDNALRVLELLSSRPSLRVVDVARHLEVARSTAHRILCAMVDRGFVVQDSHRVYHAGPAIERLGRTRIASAYATKELVHPHLERLADGLDESCHVAVLEGNGARFIDGVESSRQLRVGSRIGMLLPAHKTAIGVALLAELPLSTLRSIYPRGLTGDAREVRRTLPVLERMVYAARRTGFAINLGDSDPDIAAIATCLRDPYGRAFAGIAVAVPISRFEEYRREDLTVGLAECVDGVRADLVDAVDVPMGQTVADGLDACLWPRDAVAARLAAAWDQTDLQGPQDDPAVLDPRDG